MRIHEHVREFEDQGYTVVSHAIDPATTAAIRAFMDRTIQAGHQARADDGSTTYVHRICHPMIDPLVGQLAVEAITVDLATMALRAANLRLRQQMFLLTSPSSVTPPSVPDGWHMDFPFVEDECTSTPRRTFVQFFWYCNTVRPGGAATMVVPGSHKLTYAVASSVATDADWKRLRRDIAAYAGIDVSKAVELCGNEGDLIMFDPMLLHSGSNNTTDQARYAYHSSYYDKSATRFSTEAPKLLDVFPEPLAQSLPPTARSLMER